MVSRPMGSPCISRGGAPTCCARRLTASGELPSTIPGVASGDQRGPALGEPRRGGRARGAGLTPVNARASATGAGTRTDIGYLLAKASQHWNELLGDAFRAQGHAEVRPSHGSVLVPLFEEDGLRMSELAVRAQL